MVLFVSLKNPTAHCVGGQELLFYINRYFMCLLTLFKDERTFRMYRATQLYMQKTILPKDQWPTFEEDVEHGRYLDQYLEEVQREKAEKSMWAKR